MVYVDKTRFIRALERFRFAFLVRPRRFGKSLWVSLLEHYYDRTRRGAFEAVFGGTEIAADPTTELGRHVVLRFDFSAVGSDPCGLAKRFERHCRSRIASTLLRNADRFSAREANSVLNQATLVGTLGRLFALAAERRLSVCVLIDDYDYFADAVIAERDVGRDIRSRREGDFFRSFFAALKVGSSGGALRRLFLTGVCPISPDDGTGGFNFARNISLSPRFSEMAGFTRSEVRGMLRQHRKRGMSRQNADEALDEMGRWCDGYRFFEDAATTVFNPDAVVRFLKEPIEPGGAPHHQVEEDSRAVYERLRALLPLDSQTNGTRDVLRDAVANERIAVRLQTVFPMRRVTTRRSVLSLLHYFGLLGIRGIDGDREVLGIPNATARRILDGLLRDAGHDPASPSQLVRRRTARPGPRPGIPAAAPD